MTMPNSQCGIEVTTMALNNYRVQFATAYPGVKRVPSKKGTTFTCDVLTEENVRKEAFVKLLRTEDVAKEIFCATLGRFLHLPIKQAYYVLVDPGNVEGRLTGNNHNIAFGMERDYFPTFPLRDNQLESELLKWPDIIACATFDEWICNNDRLPQNVLFAKNGEYWLIDHDEALPNSAEHSSPSNSSLLQLLAKNKSEFELHQLRNAAMSVANEYRSINWEEFYGLLRVEQFPQCETSYRRYISFLRHRLPYLHNIITESVGIRQQELGLNRPLADKNEMKK